MKLKLDRIRVGSAESNGNQAEQKVPISLSETVRLTCDREMAQRLYLTLENLLTQEETDSILELEIDENSRFQITLE